MRIILLTVWLLTATHGVAQANMAVSLATYKKRLAYQVSPKVIKAMTAAVKRSYQKYGRWINLYRGGLPAGVFAAFGYYESNWRMGVVSHDPVLGEVGFFAITRNTPKRFGLAAKTRYTPETNVFLGGLEYNDEAARFAILYPEIILGTADSWKVARLVFAIGRGGTKALIRGAKRMGPLVRGNVYGSIIGYINKTGGIPLGRGQPAPKVWYRVHMVPVAYSIGIRAVPSSKPGMPRLLPRPPGISSYHVAPSIKAKMGIPVAVDSHPKKGKGAGFAIGLAALGLGALILAKK